LPEVDWPVADRLVRVVKTVRIEHLRRVTVSEKDGHRIKSKTAVTQRAPTSTPPISNSARSRVVHPSVQPQPLAIDTEVFQTITTDCHLNTPLSIKPLRWWC